MNTASQLHRPRLMVMGTHQQYQALRPFLPGDVFETVCLAHPSPEQLICATPAVLCLCHAEVHQVQQMRALFPQTPIVVSMPMTSREERVRVVDLLHEGVDDVIGLECGGAEWRARLRAHVRQYPPPTQRLQSQDGVLTLVLSSREMLVGEKWVHLSMKEHLLLYFLMHVAPRPLTATMLLQTVWGASYHKEVDYLRVYLCQLRHKLEADPTRPRYLRTETRYGYRFDQACFPLGV